MVQFFEKIVTVINEALQVDELVILVLSIIPFIELRGSIPYGIAVGTNPTVVILLAIFANLLIIPCVFFFLEVAERYGHKVTFANKLLHKYLDRLRRKNEKKVERWGYTVLLLFTAIPIPLTGIFSATTLAWVFGMDKKKATIMLIIGTILAAISITSLTYIGLLVSESV